MGKTIIKENSYGLLETIDPETGEVLYTQSPNAQQKKRIEKGLAKTRKNTSGVPQLVFQYDKLVLEKIVSLRLQGLTFQEISDHIKVPVHTIFYWKSRYRDFEADLANARKQKAEYFYDKIETLARKDYDKNEVPSARLKMQCYQWLAERGNPHEFSTKVKTDDHESNTVIIIDTGIPSRETTH